MLETFLELVLLKLGNAFLFFSILMVHCAVLWFLDSHTLQYASLPIVERASKLTISEIKAFEDASDDWNALWLIFNSGVPKMFLAEADWLKVNPLLALLRLTCGMTIGFLVDFEFLVLLGPSNWTLHCVPGAWVRMWGGTSLVGWL